jgi:YD repeat-containing protein
MKKQTLLLLAFIGMISAVTAQQYNLPDQTLQSTPKIKLDSVVVLSRSSVSEPWIKTNQQIYEYDKEFRLVRIVTTSGIFNWYDSPKIARFVYNAACLVDSVQFFYKPDYQISDMSDYSKFIYDSSGRLFKSTNWSVSGGHLNSRNTYSYNESGKVSEIFTEEGWWIYWSFYQKFIYDNDGKLIRYEAPGIYGDMQATYEWNAEGNLIGENYSNWYQKRNHTFFYNPNRDRVKTERYDWKQSYPDKDYVLYTYNKKEYNYLDLNSSDLVDLNLSLLIPNYVIDEQDNCPDELISKTSKLISTISKYRLSYIPSVNLREYEKSVYYYSPFPKLYTAINDKTVSDFRIFPNPASDHVTFSWPANYERLNLKIFQLTGVCLLDREVSSRETVRLTSFPKGIYVYKLSENTQLLKTGKLIIE